MDVARLLLMFVGEDSGALRSIEEMGVGLETVQGRVEHANGAFGLLQNAVPIVAAVGGALAAVGGISLKMAADFQQQTERLVTNAGEQQSAVDNVIRPALLRMSGDIGYSTEQLTEGMRMVSSAGFKAGDGLKVLEVGAKGAKSENADLGVVLNVLTSAMTDYNLKSDQATRVMNVFVNAMRSGKLTLQDLSSAMGTVLPAASASNVSIEEVSAALATMTNEGVPAADAATYLRHSIEQLQDPSAKAKTSLKEIGLGQYDVAQALTHGGLLDAITLLDSHIATKFPDSAKVMEAELAKVKAGTESMDDALGNMAKGSPQAMAALANITGGVKGMAAAVDLGGTHLSTFRQNVAYVSDETKKAGNQVEGWSEIQDNFNFQMDRTKYGLEAVGISIGTKLLPYATQFLQRVTDNMPAIQQWASSFVDELLPALEQAGPPLLSLAVAAGRLVPPLLQMAVGFLQIAAPVAGVASTLAGVLAPVLGVVADNMQLLEPVLAGIVGAWVAWNVAMAVTKGMEIVSVLMGLVETIGVLTAGEDLATIATVAFDVAMDANPIGVVVLAIGLLIGLLVLLVTHWGDVTAVLGRAWEAIQQFGGWLAANAGPMIVGALQAIGSFIGDHWQQILLFALLGPVSLILPQIISAVEHGAQAVLSALSRVPGEAAAMFDHLRDVMVSSLTSGAQRAVSGTLSFLERLPYEIGALAGRMVSLWVEMWVMYYRTATDYIPRTVEYAWGQLQRLPALIGQAVGNAANTLWNWNLDLVKWEIQTWDAWTKAIENAWTETVAAVETGVSDAWAQVQRWGQQLLSWFTTEPPKWPAAIQQAWNSLLAGIGSWISNSWAQVQRWGQQLLSWATTTPPQVTSNFVNGLTGLPQRLADLAGNAMQSLVSAVTSFGGRVYQAASNVAGQLVKGFMDNLKIGSPSRVLHDQVGVNAMLGLTAGMESQVPALLSTISRINASLVSGFSAASMGLGVGAGLSGGRGALAGVSIGSMTVNNPTSELDLISAMNRMAYLARLQERGFAPAPA